MNALMKPNDMPLTMTSQEIADLVESRHDNVKTAIERLGARGVIQLPALQEVKNNLGDPHARAGEPPQFEEVR